MSGAGTAGPPEDLLRVARAAQENAYAPYSRFHVGAALRLRDGRIVSGCNVENASYGLTSCAERNAVFGAVAAGERDFSELLVLGESMGPTAPCGACRQVLAEFMREDTTVWQVGREGWSRTTLGELLPGAFGAGDLGE